jgi:carbamoyl-phosphate synthase large subunit
VVAKLAATAATSPAGIPGAPEGAVDAVELIRSGQVQLVVNTPRGRGPRADGAHIRRAAHQYKVPLLTTVAAARAAAAGVLERGKQPFTVKSLQEHHSGH